MWISEKPDASVLLEVWASDIGRLTSTEALFKIDEGFKRSVEIRTSYLPEVRDLAQELLLVHVTRSLQEPPVRHGSVEGHQQGLSHRTVV